MMLATISIVLFAVGMPFIIAMGRRHSLLSRRPSLEGLRRSISAPTVPSRKAAGKPKAKRRATDSGRAGPAVAGNVVAEPEDQDMLSDTSHESYVRFGRGMTYVDEKIGGGIAGSARGR